MKTLINKRSLSTLCLVAWGAVLSTQALASPKWHDSRGYNGNHYGEPRVYSGSRYYEGDTRHTDYARVIRTTPIYQNLGRQVPVQSCWIESRALPSNGYQSHTPMILGTLIGGALGNEVGHNHTNKKVGAVLGGVLGASVARDLTSGNRVNSGRVVDEEVCDTRYQTEYEQRVVGYNVTYLYQGREYQTQMDQPPGKHIPVAVHVAPAY